MTDQVLTSESRPKTSGSPNPLLSVWIWELRRLRANPFTWVAVGVSFIFFLGMVWFKHAWSVGMPDNSLHMVVGTSAVGLVFEFVNVLLLVLALIIPFVVTDGVARDYKGRIHEILMATRIPTWTYVWGRFLAVLCMSLGLAVVVLIADLGMGQILARLHPEVPAPAFGNILIVWAVVIVPATIFLTGVGFTLGTLWPRRSTTLMLGMLVGWVLLYLLGNELFRYLNHLYMYLDPTSTGVLGTVYPRLVQSAGEALKNVPGDQRASTMLKIQSVLPDLSPWVLPHYGVAAVGVALVGVAAGNFRRFRDVLS